MPPIMGNITITITCFLHQWFYIQALMEHIFCLKKLLYYINFIENTLLWITAVMQIADFIDNYSILAKMDREYPILN